MLNIRIFFVVVVVVSDVITNVIVAATVFDVNVAGRQDCRLICCHTVLMMLMFHLDQGHVGWTKEVPTPNKRVDNKPKSIIMIFIQIHNH